mgnify:CR=1 FL=1
MKLFIETISVRLWYVRFLPVCLSTPYNTLKKGVFLVQKSPTGYLFYYFSNIYMDHEENDLDAAFDEDADDVDGVSEVDDDLDVDDLDDESDSMDEDDDESQDENAEWDDDEDDDEPPEVPFTDED